MTPLISVIVPVYNVEEFLPACIESLMAQTYGNIEILLIDDGAKDSSGKICDSYASLDPRIKVIHKENAGVAEARNTGMENMSGEYFCFVDGDDYVNKDYVNVMYSLMTEHNADISMCGYIFKWSDGREKRTKNFEYADEHIFSNSGNEALSLMLYSKIYFPSCCCKLYSRNKIRFNFGHYSIGEDMLASINYFQQAEKVVMSNKPLYYYIQNDESVMHSVNPDKIFDMVITGDEMLKLIPDDIKLQSAASYYIIEKNLMTLMKLYGLENQSEKIDRIKANIKKHRRSVISDSKAEMRTRIACLISYFGIKTLYTIRNLTSK